MGSLDAEQIAGIPRDEALALVDELLGRPEEWPSELVSYRLGSDFQSFWKAELGRWFNTASRHGYHEQITELAVKRARRPTRSVGRDPNDRRYLDLVQTVAECMVDHYLTSTGWTFLRWNHQEPVPSEASSPKQQYDSDLVLRVAETDVSVQVKAPDQLGTVVNGRLYDGENDDRVLKAVHKARHQLPRHRAGVIGVCDARRWSLASEPECLVVDLIGSVTGRDGGYFLDRPGNFFTPEWTHVSAVLLLHLTIGSGFEEAEDAAVYGCTVLLNPRASMPLDASAFPHASVLLLRGDTFSWIGGEPCGPHSIPGGTKFNAGGSRRGSTVSTPKEQA